MLTVDVHEAKTHFSKPLVRVSKGEEIVIAKAGDPVARLVPVAPAPRERPLGIDRGKIWMAPDFDDAPEEFVKAFYGGRLPNVKRPPQSSRRSKRRR